MISSETSDQFKENILQRSTALKKKWLTILTVHVHLRKFQLSVQTISDIAFQASDVNAEALTAWSIVESKS